MLLLFSQFFCANGQTSLSGTTLTNSPTTINQATAITFQVQIGTAGLSIPAGSTVELTAPAPGITVLTPGTCTEVFQRQINLLQEFPSAQVVACSSSGQTITVQISGAIDSTQEVLTIKVDNALINPASTRASDSFTLSVRNSAGTVIGQQTSGISLVATQGAISGATLSTSSQIVNEGNILTVSFTATNGIPVGGVIKMKFPKWNPTAPSASEQKDYFSGQTTCGNNANLNSGLSCSFNQVTSILTINDVVSNALGANTQVSFTVSGFINPISTALVSGFTIVTQDGSAGTGDTELSAGNIDITTSPTLQITQPTSFTSGTISVSSAASTAIRQIAQETNDIQFSFRTPVPLEQNCRVFFSIPTQFTIPSPLQITVCSLLSSSCSTVIEPTLVTDPSLGIDPTQLTVNEYQFDSCSQGYRSNLQTGIIIFKNLVLPENIKVTDTFTISITNVDSGASIGGISSGVTFQALPGSFTSATMIPDPAIVQSEATITFTLTPSHSVPTTSKLVITFPTTYTLPNTCSITAQSAIVQGSGSCTLVNGNIEITDFLGSAFDKSTPTSNIVFALQTVTLPMTTAPRTGLQISIQSLDSGLNQYFTIDTFSGDDIVTLQPGTITLNIVPSSLSAFAITTYTFEITPQHQVIQDGFLIIEYPPEINIPDSSFSQSQSSSFTNFPTTPTVTLNTATRQIFIRNGFKSAALQPAGTTFSFQMPSVQNPPTLDTTSTFAAYSYSDTQDIIDQVTSGVTITMTTTAVMRISTLEIGSYINADITNYTFTLAASIPIASTSRIRITFPPEVTLPTSSNLLCDSNSTSLIRSINCQFYQPITQAVDAILTLRTNPIPEEQVFQINMQNIRNPNSTKPTTSFKVEVIDLVGSSVNVNSANIVAQTNTPSTITQASITQSDTGARQITTYTIELYPTSDIQVGGGIEIIYPSQVSIPGSLSVDVISDFTRSVVTTTLDQSSRQILIRNAFQLKFVASATQTVSITLDGFQNPDGNELSNSFIVRTFDISGNFFYYIDQVSEGLTLNSNCDYPCKTCSIGLTSNCTSCFTGSTLDKLQGGTCVSDCSIGKYLNAATGACEVCDDNCLDCVGSPTTCTACGSNGFLYLHLNQCINECPPGFVESSESNSCLQCAPQCLTCQFNQNTCITCDPLGTTPLFFRQNCYSTCPERISIQQGLSCQECDVLCATCVDTVDTCTSCFSHMKYDEIANECIEVCNEGTQIFNPVTQRCDICNENCGTCSITVNTCTTCAGELVLNNDNTCRENCILENQSPIDGVCQQCQLPCATCKDTTDHCTSCQNEYLLYNTTCVQYCPDKYEPDFEIMQCILVGLICPTGFSVNEAGNGCVPTEIECQDGYIVNDSRTACIPAPGSPIPFPFLILTIILCLIVLGSYIKDKISTKVISCLIALIGTQELLIQLLILAYAGALLKWISFGLCLVSIIMLVITNIYMYVLFRREALADPLFQQWLKHYPKTSKFLPILALVWNFKLVKFFYNGFFGLEQCQASFENARQHFFQYMKRVTYFGYIFAYLIVIATDIAVLIQLGGWGYQLFVLAIESIIITIIIVILTYFEFRDPNKLFEKRDEQYMRIKPKTMNNDNVMGGFEDFMDESTLVRGYAAEEEYEINLRRKALLSILAQVDKNFMVGQKQGIDLGGKIEKVKSKFDNEKLKLRRAFSLEQINEEDSWSASSHESHEYHQPDQDEIEHEEREERLRRRYSFPLTPRTLAQIHVQDFGAQLNHIQEVKKEEQFDNVYAEPKKQPKNKNENLKKKKMVPRRTQTYLRELLNVDGEELEDSDLEVILEDDAEINDDFAKGLIENVIDHLSDSASIGGTGKIRKKKMKQLNAKRKEEVPEFELKDIMGKFDIDDMGNFIIIKGNNGELLDKFGRRVNRRGYLIDRFGNIINLDGQIIFKATELNDNDEIPAPFGYEKHKKNLLNMSDQNDFNIKDDQQVENDEYLIDQELKNMKKKTKKRRRQQSYKDGQAIDEENEDLDDGDEESSVDSLMADTPGKYQQDDNDDEIINKVTKKKVPIGRDQVRQAQSRSQLKNPQKGSIDKSHSRGGSSLRGSSRKRPHSKMTKNDAKDPFPVLTVESSEQKKLQKIVESIGGFAGQMGHDPRRGRDDIERRSMTNTPGAGGLSQERFEKVRRDNLRDTYTQGGASRGVLSNMSVEYNRRVLPEAGIQTINPMHSQMRPKNKLRGKKKHGTLPNHLARIYGNLNDIEKMEEQQIMEHLRTGSPHSSEQTSRLGGMDSRINLGEGGRKIKGLENIYLQRFEQKRLRTAGGGGGGTGPFGQMSKRRVKPKYRQTIDRFHDDPSVLLEDDIDYKQQVEMANIIDQTERLQKQYANNASSNRFTSVQNQSMPLRGFLDNKSDGRTSAQMNRQEGLGQVKKGTWMDHQQ